MLRILPQIVAWIRWDWYELENSQEFDIAKLSLEDLRAILSYTKHMVSVYQQNRKNPDYFKGIPARIRDQILHDCAPDNKHYSEITKTWLRRLIPPLEIARIGVRSSQTEKFDEAESQMVRMKDELEAEDEKRRRA